MQPFCVHENAFNEQKLSVGRYPDSRRYSMSALEKTMLCLFCDHIITLRRTLAKQFRASVCLSRI